MDNVSYSIQKEEIAEELNECLENDMAIRTKSFCFSFITLFSLIISICCFINIPIINQLIEQSIENYTYVEPLEFDDMLKNNKVKTIYLNSKTPEIPTFLGNNSLNNSNIFHLDHVVCVDKTGKQFETNKMSLTKFFEILEEKEVEIINDEKNIVRLNFDPDLLIEEGKSAKSFFMFLGFSFLICPIVFKYSLFSN